MTVTHLYRSLRDCEISKSHDQHIYKQLLFFCLLVHFSNDGIVINTLIKVMVKLIIVVKSAFLTNCNFVSCLAKWLSQFG